MSSSNALTLSLLMFGIAFLIVVGATVICTVIASEQMRNWEKDDKIDMGIFKNRDGKRKEENKEGLS